MSLGNDTSKCIASLLCDQESSIDLGEFSPGSNLSSLSLDLGNLSIDNTSSPKELLSGTDNSDFHLPSNLSKCDSNSSIAYSISFDELEVEPASYSVNTKRKHKSAAKLSVDSPRSSGYSPLATNILNINNNGLKQKRFSEFFRAELCNLNLSKGKSIESLSDKEISFKNISVDSGKENLSDLSIDIDKDSSVSSKPNKSSRFSEHFRSEVSQLHLSSPDISFDLPSDSPKNTDLSLEISEGSRDNSINKPNNDVYDVISGPVSDVYDVISGPVRSKKLSDEDGLNLVTPAHSRCRGNVIESSDEEVDDLYEDDMNIKSRSSVINDDSLPGDIDDEYESSFIDDEAVEGEETASEGEETASEEGDGGGEAVETSSSSEDDFVTPPSRDVVEETPYFTPKSVIKPVPSNLYKTPTTFCHNYNTPISKDKRRRTCLATPLSVRTKTGTPGLPNRTYNRNLLSAARELFEQFNENVFGNKLPPDLEIKVNKRLNTTAGRCVYLRKGEQYRAYIELSSKVVDCLERLKETLAHELCHAATFILDKKMDNHGPLWKRWAHRVNVKYPELPPVSRCHSYEIQYKYNYTCEESWCNYTIGRHSRSIDLERARCPLCYSRLTLPETAQSRGKTPNKWTEFVKTRFNQVKGDMPPRTPHKDLMKILSNEFKEFKLQQTV